MNQKSENRSEDVLLTIRDLRIEGLSDQTWEPIINGVNLSLRRGEVLGLIGESGAGKSTLGLAASGFSRAGCRIVSGSIFFDGVDLLGLNERQRRQFRGKRISYVAQSAAVSFNPAHRLIDQTTEVARINGLMSAQRAKAAATALFKKLRLPNSDAIGERFPHQVSGGQLQRVMTAMAMSCSPDLIIFDEPTTALDVTTQVEVLAAIRDLVEEYQTAAIYITHDLAVVAQMAHRILVLRNGKAVEEAPTREMLEFPKEDYTKSLWAVRKLEKSEAPNSDLILRIEDVTASYGKKNVNVLDSVNVDVGRGSTVAVVGESGSGKSTLARVITGLLAPHKGRVIFNGNALSPALKGRDRDQLRRIQLIYQSADTALNPRQTVRDVMGRRLELYHGINGQTRDRRIVELLEMVDLSERYIDRLPGELSGGQKQRICIARALAAKPDLMICDEVTSALDQIVQEEILTLLLRIQKELGVSYLFITHDIATVRAIADEIVVMHRGRVVEQGPKSVILSPPHPPYTELLLSSVPEMDPDWLSRLLSTRDA